MDDEEELSDSRGSAQATSSGWGKSKYDYYYTDYIDKDYPSKLTAKEERLAAAEEEEALRIQKKILSTIDDQFATGNPFTYSPEPEDINFIENLNDSLAIQKPALKKIRFQDQHEEASEDDCDDPSSDDEYDNEEAAVGTREDDHNQRARRPINSAILHNRGLTPYKRRDLRNPRVKHKLKYQKAMSKRRRNVKEPQYEYNRYSGEANGIKTSTIKSIRL